MGRHNHSLGKLNVKSFDGSTSALGFVYLTVFVYSAGFGIVIPVLPALIMGLEGVSLSQATQLGAYVGASYAIAQFLLGPLVGNLSDRFGRRPIFLVSLIGFGIDFLLMSFASSVIWLFIGRFIAGGLGAVFGPANSAVADVVPPENRAQHFGYIGAAFGIGFIIGPAIGGILAELGPRLPFMVAGLLALIAALYGFWAFPETLVKEKRRPLRLRRANPLGALINLSRERPLLPLAGAYFTWACATNIYPASWPFFTRAAFGWDSKMVGISLTILGISMALTQVFVIKRLVARFGELATAILGIIISILMFLCLALGVHGMLVMLMIAFIGLQGVVMPSINALMSQRVSASNQGELQGFNGSLAALALLIAQILYNSLLSYFTSEAAPIYFPGAPFVLVMFFCLFSLAILYHHSKAHKS